MIIMGCSNPRRIKNDETISAATLKNIIDSPNFVFIPQYVSHMTGPRRSLSSGFEVSVSKDSVISNLPFFGRGYVAPISPSDVDFDFTSTKFTNTTTSANRGWTVSIKPKDQTYLKELYFKIFDNASTSLNITSLDRSSISFEGYIKERKFDKKKK
jgi:hypothetical protein